MDNSNRNAKNDFVDAFVKLYQEFPVNKITVSRIVSTAGYNRSTFYTHFNDIYSLYGYLEDWLVIQIQPAVLNSMLTSGNSDRFLENFNKIDQKLLPYLLVVIQQPYGGHFVEQLREKAETTLIERLGQPNNELTFSYALDYHIAAVFRLVGRWIQNPDEMSKKDFTNLMRQLLTKGTFQVLSEEF
ncbi:TetR/AcrR family transcriptional regulator [Loigolactobacillus binensis]|uniref:TetR/AcrR family transcriptional regulator n=1 Tax=Loigolactobacillus binensis TaxID=2559922 RepID=A0ABW3ECE8_9LACO|nr:TetR/AcrR family transcriptional regulator [Loigolactobacillus binensis]